MKLGRSMKLKLTFKLNKQFPNTVFGVWAKFT